jgi:hypothetical protein
MMIPRVQFTLRTFLLLPPAVVLLLIAADRMTARPSYWRYGGTYEFDVVDARDKRPIPAQVTIVYEGPLAGSFGSGNSYTTLGVPYAKYRGMTPNVGYGGFGSTVRHVPRTLIFRRHDLTVTEGVRFRFRAVGYEPFEFAPVDTKGRPLSFETYSPPVFRVELRPEGEAEVPVSWSTRPELEEWAWPWANSAKPGVPMALSSQAK